MNAFLWTALWKKLFWEEAYVDIGVDWNELAKLLENPDWMSGSHIEGSQNTPGQMSVKLLQFLESEQTLLSIVQVMLLITLYLLIKNIHCAGVYTLC